MTATSLDTTTDAAAPPTTRRWFRGDIDGLRAIAILLVVAYHAEVPGFSGGFIGVDAFFVISGYLITRNLLDETDRTKRVDLVSFWAKRIRRLVPALTVLVAATLAASWLILPRIDMPLVARQGGAAALYVSNLQFANQSQDYFAPAVSDSPFLHTWSLGVEEQFYLTWPLLFLVAALAVRRRPGRLRTGAVPAFVALIVVSLGLSIWLTDRGSVWAFFGLPTRAWEFAAAGLLAAVSVPAVLRTLAARTIAALAGLGLLVAGTVMLSDQTAYPGSWPLIPVVGTLLLIIAGDRDQGRAPATVVSRTLETRPMQGLGRVSYSWYLWHWPFMVLAVAALEENTTDVRVAAGIASLGVAYLAYRFVENPFRFGTSFVTSRRRTYLMGGAATAAVLLLAAGTYRVADDVPYESLDARIQRARDSNQIYECDKRISATDFGYCVSGDLTSDRVVMIVGDSHARVWQPALAEVAADAGIFLVDFWEPGCTVLPLDARPLEEVETNLQAELEMCAEYRHKTDLLIDELQPDSVIVSQWNGYVDNIFDEDGNVPNLERQQELWGAAYDAFLQDLVDRDVQPAAFLDNPMYPTNPTSCISQTRSVEGCELAPEDALQIIGPLREAELEVLAERDEVPSLDWTDALCDDERCTLSVGNDITYEDRHHLTVQYTMTRLDELRAFLDTIAPA